MTDISSPSVAPTLALPTDPTTRAWLLLCRAERAVDGPFDLDASRKLDQRLVEYQTIVSSGATR